MKEMKPTELLPCPFCGGKAHFGRTSTIWDGQEGYPKFGVNCVTQFCPANNPTGHFSDEEEARINWNNRTPPTISSEERLAALEWFDGKVEYFAVKNPQQICHVKTIRALLEGE